MDGMKLQLPITVAPRRPRLLVVDDQPINVQTLYQALSAEHQVFVATGGEQALKLAREKQPDLILLDVVMPDIDGYEVCRRLLAYPATAGIPVIFVTAHSDGAVEIMYGRPRTERAWQLESASTMVTETGPASLGPGKRLYGLMPNNNLGWVDERLAPGTDDELVPWMSAELTRVIG